MQVRHPSTRSTGNAGNAEPLGSNLIKDPKKVESITLNLYSLKLITLSRP